VFTDGNAALETTTSIRLHYILLFSVIDANMPFLVLPQTPVVGSPGTSMRYEIYSSD
jgi:hypothetical protein